MSYKLRCYTGISGPKKRNVICCLLPKDLWINSPLLTRKVDLINEWRIKRIHNPRIKVVKSVGDSSKWKDAKINNSQKFSAIVSAKLGLWQIFQLSIFVPSREKCHHQILVTSVFLPIASGNTYLSQVRGNTLIQLKWLFTRSLSRFCLSNGHVKDCPWLRCL